MITNISHISLISERTNISAKQVENVVKLLEEGATIPFISRYRKELTGSLDEVQIGDIRDQAEKLKEVDKRRESILASIAEQGKLTDELRKKIEAAWVMSELEDLYLPYKQKRKTRATKAKELGLEPLAETIFKQYERDLESRAMRFLTDAVETVEDALQGARDIIAEWVSEDLRSRNKIRWLFTKEANLVAEVVPGKEKEGDKYRDYFKFSKKLRFISSHQLLAIRRAENEGILRVDIAPEEENALYHLDNIFIKSQNDCGRQMEMAVKDSYKRLLKPSIETEFRLSSKDLADMEAIRIFTENLRQLLLAAPLGEKRVLALDPGYRSGCKVVCLDEQGRLLANENIYPHQPQMEKFQAAKTLEHLVEKHKISAIAIGNGTASRETEEFVRGIAFSKPVQVYVVSENGASIYSASEVAREEFPDHDVTVRGSVSIGRRLMDPLAELVKIDPKSIGVGQYQHDVDQKKLQASLDSTVESCVNLVGVNLNTASKHLLTYISGLGPTLAQNIVEHRATNGPFRSRDELKKVPRLGPKAYEQCAGFLRIRESQNPLDASAVHPESYGIVAKMAKDLKCSVADLMRDKTLREKIDPKQYVTAIVGLPTLTDILKELEKPGLDPREQISEFKFDENIRSISDIHTGMRLPGIVTNVTAFGAFVDIGIKQNGLLHKSQISTKRVDNPADFLKLQQQVMVTVVGVEPERERISLSLIEN